jgi:hypothetical protein
MNDYLPTLPFLNTSEACDAAIHSLLADCPVCMGQHDDEIHAATVAVHRWFRAEVTKSFEPPVLM